MASSSSDTQQGGSAPASVSLAQAERILTIQCQAMWEGRLAAGDAAPLMLWSPPGVGKSSLVRDCASTLGVGFIDIRLSQREPVDIRGLPVPGPDGVRWLVASEWPRDPGSRGIILFDELTAADRAVQVAAYEFILDRRLGELYRLPDGWVITAAGNRLGDRAVATAMSSALANRFAHLEIHADIESWASWALTHGIHPGVIAFLRFAPHQLFSLPADASAERGWPSPRSWARLAAQLQLTELAEEDLSAMAAALVGVAAAGEFLAFRHLEAELPDVRRMLARQVPLRLPDAVDQRFMLCSSAAHLMFQNGWEHLADGFLALAKALPPDFSLMLMMDVLAARTVGAARLNAITSHLEFRTWRALHGIAIEQSPWLALPCGRRRPAATAGKVPSHADF